MSLSTSADTLHPHFCSSASIKTLLRMTKITRSADAFHICKRMDAYRNKQNRKRHERNYVPALWSQGTFQQKRFWHSFPPPVPSLLVPNIQQAKLLVANIQLQFLWDVQHTQTCEHCSRGGSIHITVNNFFVLSSVVLCAYLPWGAILFSLHKDMYIYTYIYIKLSCVSSLDVFCVHMNWASRDRPTDL